MASTDGKASAEEDDWKTKVKEWIFKIGLILGAISLRAGIWIDETLNEYLEYVVTGSVIVGVALITAVMVLAICRPAARASG